MKSRPLRLLFVIKSLAGTGGGAERVLSALTAELAERGHEVGIATFDPPGARDFYAIDPRVSRERLGIGRVARSSGPLDVLRQAATLLKLLLRRKPDVAIGFMHSAFIPLGLGAIGTRVPIVASEHTAYDHYRANGVQGALVRATAPLHAAFTATAESVRSGFPRAIARRMVVIPNPVIFPHAQTRTAHSDTRLLLSVGGLREEKGHETLIAAFATIAESFPDWLLRLVGDGPCRGALERQVGRLGLQSRVTFAGAVPDVVSEYAAADLFAMPSNYESFGIATAEALAAGVPAIGFADCPGTNEIIQDGITGLLVSGPDRVGALAQGLSKLMANDEMRATFGRAGPASVAKYSLEAVADAWEELLSSVASR